MEKFLPSEIARLVLGYLKEESCVNSYNTFLRECPHLAEYASLLDKGCEYSTKVGGYNLKEMLEEYREKHYTSDCVAKAARVQDAWKSFSAIMTQSCPSSAQAWAGLPNALSMSSHQARTAARLRHGRHRQPPPQVVEEKSQLEGGSSCELEQSALPPFTCYFSPRGLTSPFTSSPHQVMYQSTIQSAPSIENMDNRKGECATKTVQMTAVQKQLAIKALRTGKIPTSKSQSESEPCVSEMAITSTIKHKAAVVERPISASVAAVQVTVGSSSAAVETPQASSSSQGFSARHLNQSSASTEFYLADIVKEPAEAPDIQAKANPRLSASNLSSPVKTPRKAYQNVKRDFKSPRRKSHAPRRRSNPSSLVVPLKSDVSCPALPSQNIMETISADPSAGGEHPSVYLPLIEGMLSNSQFAEVLAENINKVVEQQEEVSSVASSKPSRKSNFGDSIQQQQEGCKQDDSDPGTRMDSTAVMGEVEPGSDSLDGDLGRGMPSASDVLEHILEETQMTEETINGIINMTRNDPTLDALFNIFKVDKNEFLEREYDASPPTGLPAASTLMLSPCNLTTSSYGFAAPSDFSQASSPMLTDSVSAPSQSPVPSTSGDLLSCSLSSAVEEQASFVELEMTQGSLAVRDGARGGMEIPAFASPNSKQVNVSAAPRTAALDVVIPVTGCNSGTDSTAGGTAAEGTAINAQVMDIDEQPTEGTNILSDDPTQTGVGIEEQKQDAEKEAVEKNCDSDRHSPVAILPAERHSPVAILPADRCSVVAALPAESHSLIGILPADGCSPVATQPAPPIVQVPLQGTLPTPQPAVTSSQPVWEVETKWNNRGRWKARASETQKSTAVTAGQSSSSTSMASDELTPAGPRRKVRVLLPRKTSCKQPGLQQVRPPQTITAQMAAPSISSALTDSVIGTVGSLSNKLAASQAEPLSERTNHFSLNSCDVPPVAAVQVSKPALTLMNPISLWDTPILQSPVKVPVTTTAVKQAPSSTADLSQKSSVRGSRRRSCRRKLQAAAAARRKCLGIPGNRAPSPDGITEFGLPKQMCVVENRQRQKCEDPVASVPEIQGHVRNLSFETQMKGNHNASLKKASVQMTPVGPNVLVPLFVAQGSTVAYPSDEKQDDASAKSLKQHGLGAIKEIGTEHAINEQPVQTLAPLSLINRNSGAPVVALPSPAMLTVQHHSTVVLCPKANSSAVSAPVHTVQCTQASRVKLGNMTPPKSSVSRDVAVNVEAEVAEALVCFAKKAIISPMKEHIATSRPASPVLPQSTAGGSVNSGTATSLPGKLQSEPQSQDNAAASSPSIHLDAELALTQTDHNPEEQSAATNSTGSLAGTPAWSPSPEVPAAFQECVQQLCASPLLKQVKDSAEVTTELGTTQNTQLERSEISSLTNGSNSSEVPGRPEKKKPRRIVPIKIGSMQPSPPLPPVLSVSKKELVQATSENLKSPDVKETKISVNRKPGCAIPYASAETKSSAQRAGVVSSPKTPEESLVVSAVEPAPCARASLTPMKNKLVSKRLVPASPVRSNPLTKLLESFASPQRDLFNRPVQSQVERVQPEAESSAMSIAGNSRLAAETAGSHINAETQSKVKVTPSVVRAACPTGSSQQATMGLLRPDVDAVPFIVASRQLLAGTDQCEKDSCSNKDIVQSRSGSVHVKSGTDHPGAALQSTVRTVESTLTSRKTAVADSQSALEATHPGSTTKVARTAQSAVGDRQGEPKVDSPTVTNAIPPPLGTIKSERMTSQLAGRGTEFSATPAQSEVTTAQSAARATQSNGPMSSPGAARQSRPRSTKQKTKNSKRSLSALSLMDVESFLDVLHTKKKRRQT